MPVRRVLRPIQRFARLEAAGGVVLLAATVAALLWANLDPASYERGRARVVDIGPGGGEDLRHVVDDGLMAVFFLVVGLEVKRELVVGELSDRRAALLPLVAAVAGMAVPAAVFLAVMAGADGSEGWGIPMATDIAFALGALALLGRRVPTALTAFLLGVAVIDDIGAIIVIAVAYSDGVSLGWLAGAAAALAAIPVARRLGLRAPAGYAVLGVLVWYLTYRSGVNATIAGVAVGLVTPVHPRPGTPGPSALERLEDLLHAPSSFVILPVFALANAGIALDGPAREAAADTPVTLAVALGLVVGKTLGLSLGVLLAVRLGLSRLPAGTRWLHIVGVAALAGIGFTVSLFIAELAYEGSPLGDAATIGILCGSVVAAVLGLAILAVAGRATPASSRPAPPPP